MQDLEQRLALQYEKELEERLALHINALVVRQKEELLEMKKVHDDQISSLRKKFTRPSLLTQELEHSHRTIAVGSARTYRRVVYILCSVLYSGPHRRSNLLNQIGIDTTHVLMINLAY